MRPASRRALLKRLAEMAPQRGARIASALALIVLGAVVRGHFAGDTQGTQRPAQSEERSAPLLDGVLALPFGEGTSSAAAPASAVDNGPIEELRDAFHRADDLQALYMQWRNRPEPDAQYLAFRAARDCELLRAGGIVVELDASGERKGERERQMVSATARCRGFLTTPAAPDEVQRLEQEAAAAGNPAAQIALAADTYTQHPLAETVSILRRGLASGDPLAFDEARVLLAMSRQQIEIAGVAPAAAGDARSTDARVVALDLVGCRLGNPCGPGRGLIAIDCGSNLPCQRDAEEWLVQLAGLGDEEERTAHALADRMLAAFRRGAVDEIVRMPASAQAQQ